MKKYDYILIGSGPGAYRLSNLLAKTDRRVLVIEGNEFGGTCPNYGCEPKIFLEGAARAVLRTQQLLGHGVGKAAVLDWQQLMQTKLDRFTPWPEETRQIIAKSHDVEHGYAQFIDPQTIEVNGHQYQADKVIIATGQRPHRLAIPGAEFTHNSTDVLSLASLPRRVVFIGAGYVSLELATLLGAAGAEVTVVNHSARALKAFPEAKAAEVVDQMKKRGIRFRFNTGVMKVAKENGELAVQTDHNQLAADYVVDASGRQPNIDRLNLAAAGIQTDRDGIIVNEHLQTSVSHIYALGDVVSRPQPKLTPVAEFEGQYLFDYLENRRQGAIHYPTVATGAFTFPEIAMVGVNPDEVADDPGYQVVNHNLQYSSLYAGQNDRAKLTLVFKNKQLVGASEVGDTAVDDVNNFAPVIGLKVSGQEYRQAVINIYPALADKVAGDLL